MSCELKKILLTSMKEVNVMMLICYKRVDAQH